MENILIIEDDYLLNEGISFSLRSDGYNVFQAFSGEGAREMLSDIINLIILDIGLPDTNGYELCEYIEQNKKVPVVFLTAKDLEEDIINGFKVGCDDYITKPFSVPVLKERIKAILKRTSCQANIYVKKDIIFDMDKLILFKNNNEVPLTPTELRLIKLFIQNDKRVLTRAQIIDNVWDIDGDFVDENALNVNIRRLRNKLENDSSKPEFIKTVFGIGYIWGDL